MKRLLLILAALATRAAGALPDWQSSASRAERAAVALPVATTERAG